MILITGLLAGVLVYYWISKHQSQSSKPDSPTATGSIIFQSTLQTGSECEKLIELEEKMAYSPETDWY